MSILENEIRSQLNDNEYSVYNFGDGCVAVKSCINLTDVPDVVISTAPSYENIRKCERMGVKEYWALLESERGFKIQVLEDTYAYTIKDITAENKDELSFVTFPNVKLDFDRIIKGDIVL